MSQAFYIGGFGNGKSSAEGVANVLANHFEEAEPLTFSQAMDLESRYKLAKTLDGATVFTHSAGIMAVRGVIAESVHAFNGPLPLSRSRLLGRTVIKTARMHNPWISGVAPAQVLKYDASAIAEFSAHPFRNLLPFFNGEISRCNTINRLALLKQRGFNTVGTYSTRDVYFQPTLNDLDLAKRFGVVMADQIDGEHDVLPLMPEVVLPAYIEKYV